ncbi:MAG: hypothetical protein JST92_02385, partial [Deltaproteobacteria bacterium]|nr:hypothetical protein [Deltaproteobacteria bacterium]
MKLALFASLCALSLAGAALAAPAPLAACKKTKFKAEYSCHEEHVNPRGIEVGTCGRTQVVNTYQSGVAGNTL